MGSCMLDLAQRLFTLIGALWLIGDLLSDIVNTKKYHDMATEVNGDVPFYYPYEFLYSENDTRVLLKESCFFYASAGALVLPIPVGLVLVLIFFLYDYSRNLKRWPIGCCSNECCGQFCGISLSIVLLPLTFILAIFLSFLIVPLAWIFSPFLHISRALFALFGAKPAGESSIGEQSKSFKRFWTFVLLLGVMEQVLEALPQTIISGLFFYLEQGEILESISVEDLLPHLYEHHKTQVISLIFSAGSLLLFMAVNIFQYTFDYPNSFFGLITSLKEESNANKKNSAKKQKIEEVIQPNFASYSLEDENKSKSRRKYKQNPTSNEETLHLLQVNKEETLLLDITESEIIDEEQEIWLNGANKKENNQYEQAENKHTASLCIHGGVGTVKQLKLVNFLIQHGVPQNFALNGRLDEENCDFFVNNLEIIYCAELVRKLNGLDFEGQKLKCAGIITSMSHEESHEKLSNQSQLVEMKRLNSRQHVNGEENALEMYEYEPETESSKSRPSETHGDNDDPKQVLNDSNLPFMTRIKNRIKFKKSEKKYLYNNNEEETNSINKKVNKETNIDNVELEAKNETSKVIIENEEQNTSKNSSEEADKETEEVNTPSTSKY